MHTGHSLAAKIAYISLQTADSITAQEECPTVQCTPTNTQQQVIHRHRLIQHTKAYIHTYLLTCVHFVLHTCVHTYVHTQAVMLKWQWKWGKFHGQATDNQTNG